MSVSFILRIFVPSKDSNGLCGFSKEGFNPQNELDSLEYYFLKNPGKEEIVYEWARVIDMLDLLDLKRKGASYTIGLVTNSHIYQNYNRMPLISVNSEVMWNLYKHRMTMSDEERATLAMYLGICSKIGSKVFAATTKDEILCRMFGMAKKEDLTLRMKGDRAFKKLYEHYATRRRYEKLLGMVEERYGIRAIGLKRRTYVSFRFKTDDAFMAAIAASDKKLQAAKRKEHLAELKEKYFPTQPEQD